MDEYIPIEGFDIPFPEGQGDGMMYGKYAPTSGQSPSTSAEGVAGASAGAEAALPPGLDGFNFNVDVPGFDSDALKEYFRLIRENTDYNNSWSAAQAHKQMMFQQHQRVAQEMFNSSEAAKNRNWQEFMSNTAHQREVADLKAAGLNPILSAMNGNGASVTSGATAQSHSSPNGASANPDQSANSAITGILSSFLNAFVNLEGQRVSAEASQAVAEKYTQMDKLISDLDRSFDYWNADAERAFKYWNENETRGWDFQKHLNELEYKYFATETQRDTDLYKTFQQLEAEYYKADKTADTQMWKTLTELEHDTFIHENYPSNMYQAIAALIGFLGDNSPTQAARDFGDEFIHTVDGYLDGIMDWLGFGKKSKTGSTFTHREGEGYTGRVGKF